MDRETERVYRLHQEKVIQDMQSTCRILGPLAGDLLLQKITRWCMAFRIAAAQAAQDVMAGQAPVGGAEEVKQAEGPACEK